MDRIDFKLLFAAYLKQLGYTQTATLLLDSSFTKNDTKDETIMAHHINNLFTEYYSWDGHVSNRALASLDLDLENPDVDLSHLFNRIIEVEKERSPLLNYEPSLVALASQEGKKIARSIRFVPGCYLDRRHSMNKYNRFTERGVGFILPWVSDPWSQTLLSDLTSSRYRHLKSITGHRLPAYCVLFDKADMRVISGGDDGLVKIWCVRTGLLIFTLRGHSNCISDLSIDSKNSVLAVGSLDGYVSFWDLQMGRPLLTINVFSPVVTIEFRPTDSTPAEVILAVTCSDGYAKFWAIDLQKRTYSQSPIKFHCKSLARDVIRCASLSPGGRRFIVGSTDGIIRMFRVPEIDEIKSGQPKSMALPHVQYLDDHEGYINSVHFSSTGTSFVTSSSDGCIRLWSNDLEILIKNDPIARFRKFPHLTTSGWTSCLFATFKENERPQKVPLVSFCCSDRALISAVCQTRELVIFSLNCEKLNDDPVHIKYHTGEIQILTTNPSDDRIVLSADASGRVAVWFIDQEAPAKNRLGHMTARLKIKRVFEYYQPSVLFLDGCFSNDGVYFSLVDDLGRISLFGAGVSATPYSVAPLSQFFPGDWNELTFDSNHNAFDAVLSRAPHLAPRHPIVSIERRPFPAITPSPNYAYSIPIETSNDNLRTTFDQLFKLQFENESKQLDREVMETVPGALPKNPRIRRRKLLFGSDLEETEVEGNIATIAAEAATNAASLEEDDEVFVRRQRTLGAPPRDDIDSRRNLQIPSETDAEVSITSTNTSPMEGRTRARNYNLRRRTIVERATRPVSRPAIDPESTIQIDSDDDQVYRPAYGIRSFFRRHSIRTRSQRLLGESSSSNSQDEASDDDEMQASTLYTNTYSRRERGYLPYVPQIYDTVTYIREGHECFLESISLENHPDYHQSDRAQSARRSARISSTAVDVRRNGYLPWQHFPNLPPIVHGQVVNISYIPGLIGDEMAAWCVLDIMICPENMIFEGMPPITSENKSNLIRVTFTDMQGVADFVVPYCMYSWSVARLQIFTPGEVVRVIFADESSEATVVKTPEPANMISQRPWNCYGVRFLEGEDTGEELFSPWDLQPIINGSGGSVDRRSYECLESLENRVSHLIEAKVAKVCGTNRYAPFVDPVSLNDFPDYPETVAYPISLTIIRDRLQAKYYRRIESLEWDVRMIQTNTAAYNQPDSQIVQNAADLVQILLTYISRITCDRNGEQSSPNSLERRTTGDDINYGLTSLRREGALMTRDGSTDEQPSSFSNHLSRRSLRSRTLHSVEENSLGVDREVQRSRLARHLIGEVVPTSNFSESYNDEVELFSGSRTSEFGRSSSFQSRRSNQNSSIDYVNRNLQNDYGNTDYTRSNRITNDDRNNRRLDRFQRPRTCETRYQEIESDEEMEQDDPEEEVHRRPRRSVSRRAIFPESDDDFEDYSSMRRRRTNNHYSRRSDQDSSPTVMSRSRRHSGRQ